MSEQIKNNLWSLVENCNDYSFKDDPLPIFGMFFKYNNWLTGNIKSFLGELLDNPEWEEFLLELLEEVKKDFPNMDLHNSIKEILENEIADNKKLLTEVVDFFTDKYISLMAPNNIVLKFSQDLKDFLYWSGVEVGDDWVQNLALYNPFAGTSPFGNTHIDEINSMIEEVETGDYYTVEEKESYINEPWYYGVESNQTLRLIKNIGLLIRKPANIKHFCVHSGDSVEDDINDFTGGWVYLAIPTFESYKEVKDSDVKLITKLVDKFLEAPGMHEGLFLLPKLFCYDNAYKYIRSKIVCSGALESVIELPKEAFLSDMQDVIFIHLSKRTFSCGTFVANGNDYIKNGKWDWPEIIHDREHSIKPDFAQIIGDYTFSQCNYCILPSLFLSPDTIVSDNESLKECHKKYIDFIDKQRKSYEKRVEHRKISGQLSHMLGATYHKISDAISELKYAEGMQETYVVLRDSFDYMKRLINTIDEDFSAAEMSVEEISVNEFFKSYTKGWDVYGKKTFNVYYETNVDNDTTFKVNEVFLKVLLDALLENANRHGFGNEEIPNPQIKICTSYTMVNNIECIQISVANNGVPFPEDFSLEQYISEGEFGGESGHTGRGGYHVYQITKRHKGYLSLNGDSEWNVNFDIMIPVEYYQECETEKFKVYGKEYM